MTGREDVFNKAMNDGHSAAWDQTWGKAVECYAAALQEFPDNPKALNSYGLALFESRRLDESLQAYEHAARVSPTDPMPLERIAQISETLGGKKLVIHATMQAAELHFKSRNVDKAIENWLHVTQVSPENAQAHLNLAVVHAKLGHQNQAVMEYLALASILQHSGNSAKAAEVVACALQILPDNPEARQADTLLKNGQMLPPPMRPKGGTGPLPKADTSLLEAGAPAKSDLDPISAARQAALARLADLLFEYSAEKEKTQPLRRGMKAIVRGTGPLQEIGENDVILLHLGQAIDAQSREDNSTAADELEKVLEDGITDPALYYDLGMLRTVGDRLESALRYLGHSVQHTDYALGARLLMGRTLYKMGRFNEASIEYLEALKLADARSVPPEQADHISQAYESLIEVQLQQTDTPELEKVCNVIEDLLNRPDWRSKVTSGRAQLPEGGLDSKPLPLAEILTQTKSSQVIEAMENVHNLAKAGQLRSAMEEAYHSIQLAPTYLPLHILISDLLIQDENVTDAITKLSVVAHAYAVRGESNQATRVLKRVIQFSPLDLEARTRLIDQLEASGQVEEALTEYLELADLYYRQADLDNAHKTYDTALRLCQQFHVHSDWTVRILKNMADIDMQYLDWKQACRLFEQIRSIRPDDNEVRRSIIDLNIRLGQTNQAFDEVDNYLSHLTSTGQRSAAIPFLEALLEEHPKQIILRRYLAGEYQQAGLKDKAIEQLDELGRGFMDSGDTDSTIQVIESIIALDPPNIDRYRAVLEKLKAELKKQ
jgi:tetratricopeptide (TPR) repeat protein